MNIDKTIIPTKLLWVDLEMTGLDPVDDLVLEIAAEITDMDFKTLASYEAILKQPHAKVVKRMAKNTWWQGYPENRDDFLNKIQTGKPAAEVEQELISLVERHFGSEPAILAGNSIHNDRKFIASLWPELDLRLHYRMLDVTSFKILLEGKYGVNFEKIGAHRAFDDIQASIAELQFYLEWFNNQKK